MKATSTASLKTPAQVFAFRKEFPIFESKIHLANNSKGALSQTVIRAHEEYLESWKTGGAPWHTWIEKQEKLRASFAEMIGAKIEGLVDGFLSRHGQTRQSIRGWILHPGGSRLLGNVETALGLTKCQTQPSWDILGNVGNLSSATILFILQEWLEKRPLKKNEVAMAAAFGPGFSAEFLLLQWN